MNYIILPFTFMVTIIVWIFFVPITFVIKLITKFLKPFMIGHRISCLFRKLRSKIGN